MIVASSLYLPSLIRIKDIDRNFMASTLLEESQHGVCPLRQRTPIVLASLEQFGSALRRSRGERVCRGREYIRLCGGALGYTVLVAR